MNKDETNGSIRIIEIQFRALEASLDKIYQEGTLSEKSEDTLKEIRIDLINLTQRFQEVYGWNISNELL